MDNISSNVSTELPTLPLDVLVHIFEFIDDFDDVQNLTLVCKQWLEATQITRILKNYELYFSFITIDCTNKEPLALFSNSNRVFSTMYFENTKFNSIDPEFWSHWSDTISEITFDYKFATSDLPGSGNFVELLKYTPKLKTLNLICSVHLFNKCVDELSADDKEIVLGNIKHVQQLQMYFSAACMQMIEFKPWMDHMMNLKDIYLYVQSEEKPVPENGYNRIFQFLTKNGSKVKGLRICDYNRAIDKNVIQRLLEIKDLKLKALDLVINSVSEKVFTDFLCSQSELQYLTVSGVFSLLTTLPRMTKLKEIHISNGHALDGFKVFNTIKNLESLGIAGLEFHNVEDKYLEEQNFNIEKNPKLRELCLIYATIDFSPQLTKRLFECFENIRALNLDGALIDDYCLYYIFRLKKLQELQLSNTLITDDGILGVFKAYSSSVKRTKFEIKEHSIVQLKNLEVLNIDFCKRLTTRSFQSFCFDKLWHLSAQGSNIRYPDFLALGKNCPLLSFANFSQCRQLQQTDINILTSQLQELKSLELKSCSRIDAGCMQKIMLNCKKLHTLDLTNCNFDVKSIAKQMFEAVKSLRKIILHKERLYRCNYGM